MKQLQNECNYKKVGPTPLFCTKRRPIYVAVIWSRIYKDHGDVNDIYVHAKKNVVRWKDQEVGLNQNLGNSRVKKLIPPMKIVDSIQIIQRTERMNQRIGCSPIIRALARRMLIQIDWQDIG